MAKQNIPSIDPKFIPKDILKDPNALNIPLPIETTAVMRAIYVGTQIKEDFNSPFPFEKTQGFVNARRFSGIEEFKAENPSAGTYFIPKNDLISLLFDSSCVGENSIIGFRVWFREKEDRIRLVRVAEGIRTDRSTYHRDLSSTPLVLNREGKIGTFGETLPLLPRFESLPIRGYFIGRQLIMSYLSDGETGRIDANISGIEMNVRADKKGKFSIIFYIKDTSKKYTYIGLASFDATFERPAGTIVPAGGMAGSRPCPPYCSE